MNESVKTLVRTYRELNSTALEMARDVDKMPEGLREICMVDVARINGKLQGIEYALNVLTGKITVIQSQNLTTQSDGQGESPSGNAAKSGHKPAERIEKR